ncbi:MAG: hypothetical protein U0T83_07060 [Bacteriovoracaceae bacterium]
MYYQINDLLKENIKNEISSISPNVQAVDVNVIKNNIGEYQTKIKVRLKGKTIYAEKLDRFLSTSLNRCYQAIFKQIEKVKNRKKYFKKVS